MRTVVIAKEFHDRLANRDHRQGDGKFNAIEFREKFLAFLDSEDAWRDDTVEITLDFAGVSKIGPSFANEVFAYFTKYTKPDRILRKIRVVNATRVQRLIIEEELELTNR